VTLAHRVLPDLKVLKVLPGLKGRKVLKVLKVRKVRLDLKETPVILVV
jgi:hypothetical protein